MGGLWMQNFSIPFHEDRNKCTTVFISKHSTTVSPKQFGWPPVIALSPLITASNCSKLFLHLICTVAFHSTKDLAKWPWISCPVNLEIKYLLLCRARFPVHFNLAQIPIPVNFAGSALHRWWFSHFRGILAHLRRKANVHKTASDFSSDP